MYFAFDPLNDLRSTKYFLGICVSLRSTKRGWLYPYNSLVSKVIIQKHEKITFPLRNFILVLIGLPFALMSVGKRKAMTFTSIAIALVIGFLYYVSDAVGLALAKGEALLPWEGAWLTPILFTLVGLFIIFRNF